MPGLSTKLEALLFIAGRPLTVEEMGTACDQSPAKVAAALKDLEANLADRGIRLARYGHKVELVTDPALAEIVEPFANAESARPLSAPALETLAIIFYRQPVTKHEIEGIRGIGSDQIISNLLARGLIEEAGTKAEPGRPTTYRPSHEAWRQLGLTNATELPPIEEKSDAA